MTSADFLAFYPQFSGLFPDAVLSAYTEAANRRFTSFGEDAEDARRLYTAHRLTLYAQTASDEGTGVSSFARLASVGSGARVTSRRVDDVAVSYSAAAGSSASSLSDLMETCYGMQLLTLLRLHAGPLYVP